MKAVSILLLSLFLFVSCGGSAPVLVKDQSVSKSEHPQFDYVNEQYGFGINLPKDYRSRYLENGIVLRKDISADSEYDVNDPVDSLAAYTVEIVFMPFENFTEYENLNDYISFKYSGYSIEFVDYDNVSGYYVDEGLGEYAVRHFFTINNSGSRIYEAYLKLPSFHYAKYVEEFENVVKSFGTF